MTRRRFDKYTASSRVMAITGRHEAQLVGVKNAFLSDGFDAFRGHVWFMLAELRESENVIAAFPSNYRDSGAWGATFVTDQRFVFIRTHLFRKKIGDVFSKEFADIQRVRLTWRRFKNAEVRPIGNDDPSNDKFFVTILPNHLRVLPSVRRVIWELFPDRVDDEWPEADNPSS